MTEKNNKYGYNAQKENSTLKEDVDSDMKDDRQISEEQIAKEAKNIPENERNMSDRHNKDTHGDITNKERYAKDVPTEQSATPNVVKQETTLTREEQELADAKKRKVPA